MVAEPRQSFADGSLSLIVLCSFPARSLLASLFRAWEFVGQIAGDWRPASFRVVFASDRRPRDARFPENFPVHGNLNAETGSHESAHTANDLAGRRRRLRTSRFRAEMRQEWRSVSDSKAPNSADFACAAPASPDRPKPGRLRYLSES